MSAQETVVTTIHAGTSGFRGKTFVDITREHAHIIGVRYGQWLREHDCPSPTVTVGHDQRAGARELANSVIAGLRQAGVNVIDVRMAPTGLFTFAMKHMGHDGGILVTGSHMKPDRIGIIAINKDGTYATSEVTDFIEQGFAEADQILARRSLFGNAEYADTDKLEDAYCAHLVDSVNETVIRTARFNIVFDAGNGTMGPIAMRVFEMLRIEGTGIFIEPKEQPDRESECVLENCGAAIALTASTMTPFHLGIAVDGDGDRGMFISPQRGALDGDVVAGIFAEWLLDEGDVCVTPVSSGALIDLIAKKAGARVEYCRVGQPSTGFATKHFGAKFYHEAASQKFGFTDFSVGYDALYTLLKMLEIMALRHVSLNQLVDELPVFYREEAKRGLNEDARRQVPFALDRAKECFGEEAVQIHEIDGLRFTFEDGTWLLLRPSGTEPFFRIYASGQDLDRVRSLVQRASRNVGISLGLEKP